jgi:hypothetical protein
MSYTATHGQSRARKAALLDCDAVITSVHAMLDAKLLEILVCPVTKASLTYKADRDELWCRASGLAYPIRDGIPIMLEEQARQLSAEERASLSA